MQIQIFNNDQFGQLRGMNINCEPWLMAIDVARALKYANPLKAIRDYVDNEDKTVNESFTVKGTTPVLINESGLYALIHSNKQPNTQEFKRWVTSEVLPQIRNNNNIGQKRIFDGTSFRGYLFQQKTQLTQERVEIDLFESSITFYES